MPNQITMVCEAGKLEDHWALALIGNTPELGSWQPERALLMERIGRGLQSILFNLANDILCHIDGLAMPEVSNQEATETTAD